MRPNSDRRPIPLPLLAVALVLGACSVAPPSSTASPAVAMSDAHPTFYADVLPVLQENCQACHQAQGLGVGGLLAPMAFETYDEVGPWAQRIAQVVEAGKMPPWDAAEQHRGTFIGERYLDAEDKAVLVAWAAAGAPEGDPRDAPPARKAEDQPQGEWWIGDPDLVVGFAEPIHIGDEVDDWQPTVRVPSFSRPVTEPRWIRASELRFGGPHVHHIVSSHLGVGTPGRGPFEFPEGFGILLPEDPVITMNMHYYKKPGPGTAIDDDTKGAFRFYEDGDVIDYVVETDLNPFPPADLLIPAGDSNFSVSKTWTFEEDSFLLSMGPHMHYRGKAVKMELEYPDGRRELLLEIPDYDFNWQFLYQFREPKPVPAGSILHTTWWFDNSEGNPFNPDPKSDVPWGQETFNEMANARIYYASATPRHIVVGGEVPADVLEAARAEEERRRKQIEAQEAQAE